MGDRRAFASLTHPPVHPLIHKAFLRSGRGWKIIDHRAAFSLSLLDSATCRAEYIYLFNHSSTHSSLCVAVWFAELRRNETKRGRIINTLNCNDEHRTRREFSTAGHLWVKHIYIHTYIHTCTHTQCRASFWEDPKQNKANNQKRNAILIYARM